jgi:RNA-binding protein
MELTTKQRAHLKGLAHSLEPIVRIGRGGVSDAVISETAKTLEAHELIKVRIDSDEGAERRQFAADLAAAVDASLVGTIGKMAILYRRDPDKPRIKLPSSGRQREQS